MGWARATARVSTSTNLHPGKKVRKTLFAPTVLAGFFEPIATRRFVRRVPVEAKDYGPGVVIYSSERAYCVPLHSRSGNLDAKPPFDFDKTLRFIEGFRPMSGEQDVSGGSLTKAIMVDGRTVVFRVSPERGGRSGLYYELFSDTLLGDALADRIAKEVSFFLSLDDDLSPFYSIAKGDPQFYPTVKKLVGLHHVKFPTLFEITCWAILAQRSQMPVAHRAKVSLIEKFGGTLEVDGNTYKAFPDYQTLKTASVKDILAATKNRRSTG
jgi:DNA-3-methyladenine glycosylase II